MLEIIPIETPSLDDRSYFAHHVEVALVVEPQRDRYRLLALAEQHGLRITHVFETHVHNDYVSGGLALAKATDAAYHVNADDPVSFARVPVRDGDAIQAADTMRVLVTPGHTFTNLAYVLEADGAPVGVFTGGWLLYGSTGRPDLLGPCHTPMLVHRQFDSARRLASVLPDPTPVFPTHGFGSFCSAAQAEATSSTIGQEKRGNPTLILGEHDYAQALLAGLDVWPAYYAHMAPANLAGPHAPDLSPLGETPEQVAEAQRELARIGIDRPVAAAAGPPEGWAGAAPLVVLDVRRRLEWSEGDIADAVHIPLHELPRRLGDVPAGQVWVVCRSGYRATVGASPLAAHGRDVVAVDDEFDN